MLPPACDAPRLPFPSSLVCVRLCVQEKLRTKNFMMLRKSADVQDKMKRHLQAQLRTIRKHVGGAKRLDKRERRKRRRL